MGFIVIIPFAALAAWSIFALTRWLRRGDFDRSWWQAFAILGAVGIALGLFLTFVAQYKVGNIHLEGFPIPSGIANRQTPADPWVKSAMPESIRIGAMITDFLAGIALCLAPIAFAAFIKENKAKGLFHLPRHPPPP